MLGKSPIKWRQRPDMAIAVERNVEHQFKQNKTKQKKMKERKKENINKRYAPFPYPNDASEKLDPNWPSDFRKHVSMY